MNLKKKTGEIYENLTKKTIYSNTSKTFTSFIKLIRSSGLEILFIGTLFLFAGGLVNGLLEGSSPFMQNYLIFPQRGIQTFSETFVYLFTMISGSIGIYLIYIGGRQSIRQRISSFYFIIGFSTVFLAIVMSLYIFNIKI